MSNWDFCVAYKNVTRTWDLRRCLFDEEQLARMQLLAFHLRPNEKFSYDECRLLAPVDDEAENEAAFLEGDSNVARFWLDKSISKTFFFGCFTLHELLLKKQRYRKNMLPPACLRSFMQHADAKKLVINFMQDMRRYSASAKAILFAFICRCAKQGFATVVKEMHFSDVLKVSDKLYLKLVKESAPTRDAAHLLRTFEQIEQFVGDVSQFGRYTISTNPRLHDGVQELRGLKELLEYFFTHYGARKHFAAEKCQQLTFIKHYLYRRVVGQQAAPRSTIYIYLKHAPEQQVDAVRAAAQSRIVPMSEHEMMDGWFIRRVQAQ